MIRKAKVGERVEIIGFHKERSWKKVDGESKEVCSLDTSLCRTGTVFYVNKVWAGDVTVVRYVSVKLDPPNTGVALFRPKELRRIP